MTIHDVALIGTSPLSMLEAIYQKLNNKTVILLEKSDKIGGSWTTVNLKTRHDVDIGPHYISAWISGLRLLNHMGFQMKKLSPREEWRLEQPTFGLKSVTYDQQWVISALHNYHSKNKIGKCKTYIHLLISGLKATINNLKNKRILIYPEQGMGGMMRQFQKILNTLQITVQNNFEASKISYDTNRKLFSIQKNSKEIIQSKTLLLTSFSNIKEIKIDNKTQTLPAVKTVDLLELHLIIRDADAAAFSAIKFPKYQYIADYVTDITNSTQAAEKNSSPDNIRVLAIRLQHADTPQTNDSVNKVIKHFQKQGVLSTTLEIIEYNWYLSSRPFREITDWNHIIQKTNGNLQLQYTGSFGVALHKKINQWQPVLEAHNFQKTI